MQQILYNNNQLTKTEHVKSLHATSADKLSNSRPLNGNKLVVHQLPPVSLDRTLWTSGVQANDM